MAKIPNTIRRNGIYYVRLRVPKELRDFYTGNEIWRSLKTADPQKARISAPKKVAEIREEFEQKLAISLADENEKRRTIQIIRNNIPRYMQEHFQRELKLDEQERRIAKKDKSSVELYKRTRPKFRSEIGNHLAYGDTAIIEWAADEIIGKEKLHIEKGSPIYDELCQNLLRAQAQAEKIKAGRDSGEFEIARSTLPEELTAPLSNPAISIAANEDERLLTLVPEYLSSREDISKEWRTANERILTNFMSYAGRSIKAGQLDKKLVRNWVNQLKLYPARSSQFKGNELASFQQIIERNDAEKKPCLEFKTINKYLSALSAFMKWLIANDYLVANPCDGMSLPYRKAERKRDPFSMDDLNSIFSSPIYTGCENINTQAGLAKVGAMMVSDHRFWLPLLGLYSGARLGELIQLTCADVQEIGGIMCMSINTNDEKSVKNSNAIRIVPLHPVLLNLGFKGFLEVRSNDGESKRLFPEVHEDSLGRVSSIYSKQFAIYLKRIGVKTNARKSFHSFRHTFIDELRKQGRPQSAIAAIVGHGEMTTTSLYGNLDAFRPQDRLAIICDAKFEGLDFRQLSQK